MNKTRLIQWMYVAVIFILTACQGAGQPGGGAMFRPGDSFGSMRLATGAAEAPPLWAFCSASQEGDHIKSFNCRAPMLPTLAIGHIFLLSDEAFSTLDWSELAWELSIDDKAVDLESFGTFEYVMPSMTKSPSLVREVFKKGIAWNIVLTNLSPGEHTLRFLAQNDTDTYTWFVNLVIEQEDGSDISSEDDLGKILNPRHMTGM